MRMKKLVDSVPALKNIWIKGEISNFKLHYSGHIYMTLKDEGGVLRAVMFKSSASKLGFVPDNGMKVLARGRISVYERDGGYQLYIEEMQPDGLGALHLAYEQLKARLEEEGLFREENKKPIPKYPSVIGVVTASTGAAIRDIINVLKRRYPIAKVLLYPSLVQGDEASADICRGIEFFNEKNNADVLIVGRGGGSIEDLWAFNEEATARAIYNSKIPIISAVGHETDFTIADFVADMRAPTPSAAAEIASPSESELRSRISAVNASLIASVNTKIKTSRLHLEKITVKDVKPLIDDKRMDADALIKRIERAMKNVLSSKRESFRTQAARLEAMSPLEVLSRGYSVCTAEDGSVISKKKQAKCGEKISVRVSDGEFCCTVNEQE